MSPLSLVLIAAILLFEAGYGLTLAWAVERPWLVLILSIAPACIAVLASWLACRSILVRMPERVDPSSVRAMARSLRLARRVLILNAVLSILLLDWLVVVRGLTGNLILLDELVAIAPVLLSSLLMARFWYPIDRQLRVGVDAPGNSWDGWRFAWGQMCMDQLLVLIPALLVMGVIELAYNETIATLGQLSVQCLLLGGVVLVFLCTPLLMRVFLGLKPMKPGHLRDRLEDICRRYRIRIRGILLWPTGGAMLNAAVIGLTGRLRYIIFTETLIDTLPEDYVEAVMAHEAGHVRHAHIPWMFASIVATVLLIEACIMLLPVHLIEHAWIQLGLMMISIWLIFGWVSRRFERQADSFAAVHMSGPSGDGVVTLEGVTTVMNTLDSIASLNGVPANRYSWRHGSTSWRCGHLEQLTDCPSSGLPVDRCVLMIKMGTLLIGLASALVLLLALSGPLA